jgi:superfamily II DNA or RNA helicase
LACLREDLKSSLDIFYEGDGDKIARDFYIPVLKRSSSYDRVSGYFSVDGLVVVAAGLAGLIDNGGKMRLILGAHDLGKDLTDAYIMSKERAEDILKEIGASIAAGLERVEDIFSRRRIEALAWMLANGTLEVKVAIPKRTYLGLGNGIFHEKILVFSDGDDCRVAAAGSANETRAAYTVNGENLTIHMSWRNGSLEYLERYQDRFESLWSNSHPDYYVLPLPQAIEGKLKERFYPESPPKLDPSEDETGSGKGRVADANLCAKLVPAARFVKELGSVRGLAHLGLGPVRLYPHQAFAVDFALGRFPQRVLLADEVGLGKTLEAGAIIKRLINMKRIQRVLILSPKNVARQWLDEMWYHFALRFWLFEPETMGYIASDGSKTDLDGGNPFEKSGIDFMIASWHYARGSKRRPSELMQASRFFDLVVVDEAHNARMKRDIGGKVTPTKLNELCTWLSVTSPNIILMTATPVQLHSVEALDLLRILGVGGPWVHEADFAKYYDIVARNDEEIDRDEWLFAFRLAAWAARSYLSEDEVSRIIVEITGKGVVASEITEAIMRERMVEQTIYSLVADKPNALKALLLVFSPVQWFMIRNTREKLEKLGYTFPERDLREEPVILDRKHQEILENLDTYLSKHYAKYESYLSPENRGVLGFVRSIYHQRFVSSFTAAYLTVKDRRIFLQALLDGDREALQRVASKMLRDEEWEGDDEDLADAMEEAFEKGARQLIIAEMTVLRDLEDRLQNYDPEILSGDDPKMKKIVQVVDELVGQGHKVLVFSKYTDTVDAVVRFLGRTSTRLSKGEIGVYTGAGGQVFDAERRRYLSVGKEQVRKSLESGPVRVLICSDAASEGLNLQAASAVVNVDMPWNPARVEQRIGRSDRLGQKAAKVLVRNVWYPDSIEAQMYRVLFQRKELYRLVIGPAQEIVSDGLRRALDAGAHADLLRRIVSETLQKLQSVREDLAKTTGSLSGAGFGGGANVDDQVISATAGFAIRAAKAVGYDASISEGVFVIQDSESRLPKELARWNGAALEPGKANALTPAHPLVQWLADMVIRLAGHPVAYDKSVYLVRGHDGLADVSVIEPDSSTAEVVSPDKAVNLLDEMLLLAGES